jgi:arsenate reductase
MIKFYHYSKCQTCVRAKKYLTGKKLPIQEIDITTSPPTVQELKKIMKQSGRPIVDFLNRSGVQYRAKNMKEQIKTLSEDELVTMLSQDGRLIKRPIVTDGKKSTVGFHEEEFIKQW